MNKNLYNQSGLSLIELMIVVAIIGILAALSIPRFQQFQAKARQAEAKTNLTHIYTLQQTYHAENDIYARVRKIGYNKPYVTNTSLDRITGCNNKPNEIGFILTDCRKVKYQYLVLNFTNSTFIAEATSVHNNLPNLIVPGCSTSDEWTINEEKTLINTSNAVALCN